MSGGGLPAGVNYWVRFWVVLLSLMVAIGALGVLSLSFVFPDADLFGLGAAGRLGVALAGAAAVGVVVWSSLTFGDVVAENPPRRNSGR